MIIVHGYYGTIDKSIDISTKCGIFVADNKIIISNRLNLKEIFGDPSPGQPKKIFLCFEKNNYKYKFELDEFGSYLRESFNSDFFTETDYIPSHPLATIPNLELIFNGLYGIEIGGPSTIINQMGIYNNTKMDCVNFSTNTIWSKQTEESPFKNYDGSKILGKNFIMDAINLYQLNDNKYDFLVASHILEHIANPLRALEEWRRVIKLGGKILVILPWKEKTFDHKRNITPFEDIISHYKSDTKENDLSHLDEILELHDLAMDPQAGNIEQFRERSLKNYENRTLHHHVFDFDLIVKSLEFFNFKITQKYLIDPFHQIVIATKQ